MSVTSTSTDSVQTIVDLLDGYTGWSLNDPEVYLHQEVSQQEKENNPDPAIYVWSPVDADLSQGAAGAEYYTEFRTVEAQIWTLNSQNNTATETYHQEAIDFLREYSNDNESNTTFHKIQPDSATDSRSEHIRRMTDHYIMSVQVRMHNHRDS